jgi:hypothetical protein
MNRPSAFLLLALPLCLDACASPGTYPSLARRPAEHEAGLPGSAAAAAAKTCPVPGAYPGLASENGGRVTGTAEPATPASPPAPSPPSPALQTNVEQLIEQAGTAHGDFQAQSDGTRRTVEAARGSATASDSWVNAYVALASLEAARNPAVTALSEIDVLYANERIANPANLTPAAELLAKAREQVKAWIEEENDVIEQIEGILSS